MTWVLTGLGALLVLAALRDIFHMLWHPHGFGSIGRQVFRTVWAAARVRPTTELSGPLGLLAVVGVWALMVVAGWTLIYLPHMPEGFTFGKPPYPGQSSDLLASAYLSLVAVGTLGFGDIVPNLTALRLLVPLQALIGFVLFTAAISWVLTVYPALTIRRTVAKRLSVMATTDTTSYVRTGDPGVVCQLLQTLVEDLITVRSDLVQYGETYYFREKDREVALAATLPYALDLVAAGRDAGSDDVRHLAAMLEDVVVSTAQTLQEYVGEHGSTVEILGAFADEHGHQPLRA